MAASEEIFLFSFCFQKAGRADRGKRVKNTVHERKERIGGGTSPRRAGERKELTLTLAGFSSQASPAASEGEGDGDGEGDGGETGLG
jgi:hypothetical protein